MTRLLPILLLTACSSQPVINTISLPQSALQERPQPVLEGQTNRAVGIYALECKAALEAREDDIRAIKKAVAP